MDKLTLDEYMDLSRRNRLIINELLKMGKVVEAWDVAVMFFAVAFCDDESSRRGVEISEEILEKGEW
jgi:hypothetical protein